MVDDKQLRQMTCDPKFRRALVTDGKTEVGQAMVRALIDAEASLVWVGHAEPWKKFPGFEELQALPQVTLVALDLTDPRSVRETAASIGGRGGHSHQHRRGFTAPTEFSSATARTLRGWRWT